MLFAMAVAEALASAGWIFSENIWSVSHAGCFAGFQAARAAGKVVEPLGDRMGWVESRKPRHGHARGCHGNATVVILILAVTYSRKT
jgi:hypothetical protein